MSLPVLNTQVWGGFGELQLGPRLQEEKMIVWPSLMKKHQQLKAMEAHRQNGERKVRLKPDTAGENIL